MNTAIALYYYFRVIVYMFVDEPLESYALSTSSELILALIVTTAFTLGIGLYFQPFIDLAKSSVLKIP